MFNKRKIETNVKEKFSFFQMKIPSMLVTNQYNTLLMDCGFKTDMFNIICCTGRENQQDIHCSIQYFREKEFPFCWWVGFEEDPDWLRDELEHHGLRKTEEELAMATDVDDILWPEKRNDFRMKQVTSHQGVQEFLKVMSEIMPVDEMQEIRAIYHLGEPYITSLKSPFNLLVGYLDGMHVATCSVFFSQGIASIFDVIVSPKMRGQGLGKLVTTAGMEYAVASGYKQIALTATNDAKYLYEKLGFKELKMMGVYT